MILFRIGTARPTLYHVLHDDNHFSSDDIQQLTYWVSRQLASISCWRSDDGCV